MSQDIKQNASKVTIHQIKAMYHHGVTVTAITAYDYTMARILDGTGIDIILVGDSLGMVIQGEATTLPVEIEHMEYHTRCVARGVRRAHVVTDMPFMSYQVSFDAAVHNAGKLIKAGAEAVKIEGGEEMAELVYYLTKVGVPVMGHIGLRPQAVHAMGGYKIQGKSKSDADRLLNEAKILEDAGAYALVLEGIPMEVAKEITDSIKIPTIGIGSGPHVSGQILVCYDVLGADPSFKPRFVRRYLNLHDEVQKAVKAYIEDVRSGSFPGEKESVRRTLVEVKAASRT